MATPQPCRTCAWCRFNLLLHGRAYLSLCTQAEKKG